MMLNPVITALQAVLGISGTA